MSILSKGIGAVRAGIIGACTFALLLAAQPAQAAKRIALVIGNNAYAVSYTHLTLPTTPYV